MDKSCRNLLNVIYDLSINDGEVWNVSLFTAHLCDELMVLNLGDSYLINLWLMDLAKLITTRVKGSNSFIGSWFNFQSSIIQIWVLRHMERLNYAWKGLHNFHKFLLCDTANLMLSLLWVLPFSYPYKLWSCFNICDKMILTNVESFQT